ncbi:hypothetical protein EGW08_022921 [Elysia chlorotica]|uniref:C-type lectin domain-containing protein n=1 Tax=Elysia chlorotica TaxID=188477 RepID=A0A433SJN5_ELYCH|nr:hypothetical protein EGW08_022921 [Elysia chlorotica]
MLTFLGCVLLVPLVKCQLFDFHFVHTLQNSTDSARICANLGYDGLAIVKSPEAYNHFLKISLPWRTEYGRGVYIGFSALPDTTTLTWQDGSVLAPDMPWGTDLPGTDWVTGSMTGFVSESGRMRLASGSSLKFALCGNLVGLLGWFNFQQQHYIGYIVDGPQHGRLTILCAATLETGRGYHDSCLSRSHYTDTDSTSMERNSQDSNSGPFASEADVLHLDHRAPCNITGCVLHPKITDDLMKHLKHWLF